MFPGIPYLFLVKSSLALTTLASPLVACYLTGALSWLCLTRSLMAASRSKAEDMSWTSLLAILRYTRLAFHLNLSWSAGFPIIFQPLSQLEGDHKR